MLVSLQRQTSAAFFHYLRLNSRVPVPTHNISHQYCKRLLATSVSSGLIRGESVDANSEEEFRVLDLVKSKARKRGERRSREKQNVLPPRYKNMPFDQDWPNVWPTSRTFHPASVPLPLHQGYVQQTHLSSPTKWANAELMKIVNFLHLTPPAVKRQCEAIKKFCTPWPNGLPDEQLEDYFPVEIITTDYCHSSPIINDKRARIVTLKVRLSYLDLDEHAKDKFRRLVGDRYDATTDCITLVCNYCPLRKQNFEHSMYLLTALYHESNKIDTWEAEKSEEDMEKYVWEGSVSQSNLAQILNKLAKNPSAKPSYLEPLSEKIVTEENIVVVEPVKQYRESTVAIHNAGETKESMDNYGESVRKLFNLSKI